MIISASRRTDIPAFHSDWFFEKLRNGFVDVANPRNRKQIRRVTLTPETVDCIVFWTKNAKSMLSQLDQLGNIPFYFQYTVTAYGDDVEKNVPKINDRIDTFCSLSEIIGQHRIIWRYDPILFTPVYDINFHIDRFEFLASSLKGHTQTCIISFVDFYNKIKRQMRALNAYIPTIETVCELSKAMYEIATKHGINLAACCEPSEMLYASIGKAHCIDVRLAASLSGKDFVPRNDRNQRPLCNCAPSIDIGTYGTCSHGCLYCYA